MGRCKVAGFLWGLGGAGRRVELQVVSVSGAQCCGVRGRSRGHLKEKFWVVPRAAYGGSGTGTQSWSSGEPREGFQQRSVLERAFLLFVESGLRDVQWV